MDQNYINIDIANKLRERRAEIDVNNLSMNILSSTHKNEDGKLNKNNGLDLCGKIAGICYAKDSFEKLKNEPKEVTDKRIKLTLNMGHHSVYDHVYISLDIKGIPKIIAMIINNEKQYVTSEKSARYTPVVRSENSIITKEEETLYNKWMEIFKRIIKEEYGSIHNESKIEKLAQENSRSMITVFLPTQMIYSSTLRQLNYMASWMLKYIEKANLDNDFELKLSLYMETFINELDRLNILIPELMKNEKNRELSLFAKNISDREEYFGDIYCTTYEASFVYLAQAQRHRTINYEFDFLKDDKYFIPPILKKDDKLVEEWVSDMKSIDSVIPQGKMISINERGTYENFILKAKERICSAAQLEIMLKTREILEKYEQALKLKNHQLKNEILNYMNGARCTFPDYRCLSNCKFKEGINLKRRI